MAFSYYNAKIITNDTLQNEWQDDYQNHIAFLFENASNVYTIQEENTIGSLIFTDTKVRITHMINDKQTGDKLGDDWRELIFPTITYDVGLGKRFKFDNNIFMTVNTDNYHYVTKSCVIKRFNNILSYYLPNGFLVKEPCIIDFKTSKQRIEFDGVNLAEYDLNIVVQANNNTKPVLINQRFVIDGYSYKTKSVHNYRRQETMNPNSVPFFHFGLMKDPLAPDDDLINNIANTNQYKYSLKINQPSFTESIGYTQQLSATLKLNDTLTTQPLTWTSSDITKATIDGNGNISLLSVGSVIITCNMISNPLVTSSITINVINTPIVSKSNLITPNTTYIYEGKSQIYTVNGFTNGVVDTSNFTITASGLSADYYRLTIISGNSFKIDNLKKNTTKLHVVCINTNDGTTVTIDILLKGLF